MGKDYGNSSLSRSNSISTLVVPMVDWGRRFAVAVHILEDYYLG